MRFLLQVTLLLVVLFLGLMLLSSCASLREGSIISLNFSDQAPTALMQVECNGIKQTVKGVFVCEETEPRKANVRVKVMPVKGRVIFSNGMEKRVNDFNWGESNFLIWKRKKITDTWVDLDLGELNSIFGDMPLALDVAGYTDSGVIVNRGIVYHRTCNNRDIACSSLVVNYDCSGIKKNTWKHQLGVCSRMSGSPQSFEIPFKTLFYELKIGDNILIYSGRTGFKQKIKIQSLNQPIKINYQKVITGPDVVAFIASTHEQGVLTFYQTYVLLVGFSPDWTGIDNPHFLEWETKDNFKKKFLTWYPPVEADLLEVVSNNDKRRRYSKNKIEWNHDKGHCAYAWDRSSGDIQTTCVDKNWKIIDGLSKH